MGLKGLIARRIILAVPTALGVATVIFAVLSVMSPIMRVAYFVGSTRDLRPENLNALIHAYGLDQPIHVQYFNWLKNVMRLDFGRSFSSEAPAMSLVFASLPVTLELLLYSVPLIIVFGVSLGTKAALHHNKTLDHAVRVIGTLGTSLPVFVTAGLAILICLIVQNPRQVRLDPYLQVSYSVDYDLNLRMAAGTFTEYTQMITIDALLNGDIPLFLDAMAHLILPVGVLVFTQCAALIRVTRSSLIEESGKWYIVSAMSKGLSKKEAMYKHARRNASVSVLTLTGLLLANMFVGLVIVETVFRRPGFAYLVASASRVQDTPVVFACATLIALFYVLVNLAIDVSYEYIDPRIRLG